MSNCIAVLNQKGGSGKTTLTVNLACALVDELPGRVLIADADPQSSALAWADAYTSPEAGASEAERPVVVGVDRDNFDADLEAVGASFEAVLVDGAPRMHRRQLAALRAATVVLVPVQPSAFDVWATRPLVESIQAHQETFGRPEAAFVVSRAVPGTRLAGEARQALGALGLPVLSTVIAQRVAFPEAAALGLSVVEFEPQGKAAAEIRALAREIIRRYGQAQEPR